MSGSPTPAASHADVALAAIRSMPDTCVVVADRGLHVTFAEGPFFAQRGYEPATMPGRHLRDVFGAAIFATYEPTYRAALQGHDAVHERDTDDGRFTVRTEVAPQRDTDGGVTGILLITRDVTEARRDRRALEASERQHRLIAQYASDMLSVHAPDGSYRYASPGSQRLLGLAPEALVGRDPCALIHAHDRAAVEANDRRLREHGGTSAVRYRIRHADGGWRWVETNAMHVHGDDGTLAEIHCSTRDVEAERADEELRRQWEACFALTRRGIVVTDPDSGVIRAVNPSFASMHGGTPADFHGRTLDELVAPAHAGRMAALRAAASDESYIALESEHLRRDGQHFPVRLEVIGARDADGRLLYRVGWCDDLTDQHRGRTERERADARFTAAFEHAPIGIGLLGVDGRWQRVNGALCRLLGRDADELVGARTSEHIHPEDLAASMEEGRQLLHGGRDRFQRDLRYLHADGTVVWGAVSASVIRDADGAAQNFIVQVQDVTERRRHEQALAAARDEAVRASAMKSQFVATMSHEIRTPMNGVIGMLELLRSGGGLDPEQRRLLDTAGQSADLLLCVINDVLDLSKVEAGHLELTPAPCDLRALVREVNDVLAHRCLQKGIGLAAEVDDAVPSTVLGDATRLRQVLLNLAGNAVKFTDAGHVTIRVAPDAGDRIRFTVRDTGVGVEPGLLDGIFEPFAQADPSTTRRFGGTGLGLAISKQLAELMGGAVGATSTPGDGSTFWFTAALPACAVAGAAPPGEAPPPVPAGAGRRVLVAEDNPVNQTLAALSLRRHGYEVDLAADGREAVAMAGRHGYALILMDCQMPHLDGLDATRAIRAAERGDTRTPIVAMTAGALNADRDRCLAAGMDDFLAKPMRQADLDGALTRWVPAG